MRKDLEQYIYSLQNDMNKMDTLLKKANESINAGELSESQCQYIMSRSTRLHARFDDVMYFKYLLDKKPEWLEKLINSLFKARLNKVNKGNTNLSEDNKRLVDDVKTSVEELK